MGQTKVVPQSIQNRIKAEVNRILKNNYDSAFDFHVNEAGDTIINGDEFQLIMVVIPAQSIANTEVRNG